ncbi:hypothetical protein [Methylacidimicrobium tartarophylax]|uniref:Uncharacterized protein n=1 Tax=Methylacidimicrobium tartarophylax TaxID=1041768 RepID=A0A5E6MFT6_9BACT|nr:hypothetical protein [Methylacidimicrobium tartarophylax]VVM07113.1 hypothetical protein MAMT_01576 [Methylacidimicrobium tartarophylax]
MNDNPRDPQGLQEIECVVVLLASAGLSPGIINGDFLKKQRVIPDEWEIAAQPPSMNSPTVSSVAFGSGVSILSLSDRLQVSDRLLAGDAAQSSVAQIAKGLVGVFPHARYSAVGINFRAFVELSSDGVGFLRRQFLKEGAWLEQKKELCGVGLRFSYSLDGARMNLQLDDGELTKEGGEKVNGIVIFCNFHCNINKEHPVKDRAEEILERFGTYWTLYRETRAEFLSAERS